MGPCAKQVVTATLVTTKGKVYVGRNDCRQPQPVCPRVQLNCETGEGYRLCKTICEQEGHAEVMAVLAAGRRAAGATLWLEGHTYACDACTAFCREAGVKAIIIGAPPAHVLSHHGRHHTSRTAASAGIYTRLRNAMRRLGRALGVTR